MKLLKGFRIGVAIIVGVIVGVPAVIIGVWVYSANEKITSAEENHAQIKDFATAVYAKCSDGEAGIKMMTRNGSGSEQVLRPCSGPESTSSFFAKYITEHFTETGCTNPYNPSASCAFAGNDQKPEMGQTHLKGGDVASRDDLFIVTTVSDHDLLDSVSILLRFDRIVRE
jgi:hypothetical protein